MKRQKYTCNSLLREVFNFKVEVKIKYWENELRNIKRMNLKLKGSKIKYVQVISKELESNLKL